MDYSKKFNFFQILIILILTILTVFFLFRYNSFLENNQFEKNLNLLFRNEKYSVNPYEYSKTISDLELLSQIQCGILTSESTDNRGQITFYNTCKKNENFIQLYMHDSFNMVSINGLKFKFEYIRSINKTYYLFEGLIYIFFIISFFFLYKKIKLQTENTQSKILILELEKNSIQNKNKQISHDIASPLSALKMMMGLLKNIDPEVRDVMILALERTQEIFNSLKVESINSTIFNPESIIEQIITEKSIILRQEQIQINFMNNNDALYISANQTSLARIISNLLNNAIESFNTIDIANNKSISITSEKNKLNYSIIIADNGCGIPEELLSKLGKFELSHGKSSLGSGVGLFSAKEQLNKWGGTIDIKSTVSFGTKVTITLPLVEIG